MGSEKRLATIQPRLIFNLLAGGKLAWDQGDWTE
jgi:hypothetical protein